MKSLILVILLILTPKVYAVEEFILNGLPESVSQDTATPANSFPMPMSYLNSSGVRTNLATEVTLLSADSHLNDIETFSSAIATSSGEISTNTLSIDTKLTTTNSSLASIDSKLTSPLTVTGTVAATQSGTWNINNISGTISLPTGAATEATLSSLNGKVVAVNTGAVVVSSSALPSGASTEAKQDTGNTFLNDISSYLAVIEAGTPNALGQSTMSGSVPVTMASDQSVIYTARGNTASTSSNTSITTSPSTISAPAGAVGFKILAPSTNTDNIRWQVGASASSSSGFLMEPGRSEDLGVGINISVASVSGTQAVFVVWEIRN